MQRRDRARAAIVDLEETEKLEDLAGLRSNLVDTEEPLVGSSDRGMWYAYPLIRTTKTNLFSAGT